MPDFDREEIEEVIKISRKLVRSDLEGVDLSGADLYGPCLIDVWIPKANLEAADLLRAELREANLINVILRKVKYNKNTKFPEGFDPKAEGMMLEE